MNEGEYHADPDDFHARVENAIGVYDGQFKAGIKHGEGKFTWKNGMCYIGSYENGKKHGYGSLYDKK